LAQIVGFIICISRTFDGTEIKIVTENVMTVKLQTGIKYTELAPSLSWQSVIRLTLTDGKHSLSPWTKKVGLTTWGQLVLAKRDQQTSHLTYGLENTYVRGNTSSKITELLLRRNVK